MVYFACICCLGILVFAVVVEKNVYNPLAVLSGVWTGLFFFQSLGLHGLYKTGDHIYGMMIIGMVAFAFGYMVFRYKRRTQIRFVLGSEEKRQNAGGYNILRTRTIYLCSAVCICFYLLDLLRIAPVLISGGLAAVRAVCQDPKSSFYAARFGIERVIRTLFVGPFSFAILPITAVNFNGIKRDWKILFACLAIIGLRLLTEGGRVVVAYFMLHIVLAFFLTGRKGYRLRLLKRFSGIRSYLRSNKRARKRLLICMVLLIIVGMVVIIASTFARSGSDAKIHLYFYVSMQGKMFDIWSRKVDAAGIYGFGLGSLNGFFYPIIYIFKNLMGYAEFPGYWGSIIDIIQATDSEWQWMSSYGRANAFVSLFWFLYLDGRVLGIILGMFLYGAVSASTYRTALTNADDKSICICILIIQGLLFSMVRLQFSNLYYAQAFLWILLLYKRGIGDQQIQKGNNS